MGTRGEALSPAESSEVVVPWARTVEGGTHKIKSCAKRGPSKHVQICRKRRRLSWVIRRTRGQTETRGGIYADLPISLKPSVEDPPCMMIAMDVQLCTESVTKSQSSWVGGARDEMPDSASVVCLR